MFRDGEGEKEVAGDGTMCGVSVAHKRHRKHKRRKKEVRTEKPEGDETMKTNGGEPMEMLLVDTVSEEKIAKRSKTTKRVTWSSPLHMEEVTKEPNGVDEVMKPKDGEAEVLVVDYGSKETSGGKKKKTKLVTWRSPPHMEEVLINELIDYMVSNEPLHTFSESDFADVVFNPDLDAQISAYFKEKREYRADVLKRYRTNGYAELHMEVTDDEEEELSSEPVQELAYDPGEVLTDEQGEEGRGPKKEERTKKKAMKTKKPKGGEAMEMPVVDAGSKEECMKRRKTKLVMRLSQELLEYLRTKEVMGFIAAEMPRLLWPNITAELFDQKLEEEIVAQFEEDREFDAYALYQYRTKGYADIQEEVDDEE